VPLLYWPVSEVAGLMLLLQLLLLLTLLDSA
jgi:hypothetical protein